MWRLLVPAVFLLTQLRASTVTASENVRRNDCPRNWTPYARKQACYVVNEQRLRWAEAERLCQKAGGHLASVTDELENIFVFDFAKAANLSVPTIWLGKAIRLSGSGVEWHDGSSGRYIGGGSGSRSTTASTHDQTIAETDNTCVSMWLDFERHDGSWHEWDCAYEPGYASVCKKAFRQAPTASAPQPPATNSTVQKRCCPCNP